MTSPLVTQKLHDAITLFTSGIYTYNDDSTWGNNISRDIDSLTQKDKIRFWQLLGVHFKQQETIFGHLHKGHIYWRLALEYLLEGQLISCLRYLRTSSREDRLSGRRDSAAIQLYNLLAPLERHQKARWLYSLLSSDERTRFAASVLDTHNLLVYKSFRTINSNYFRVVKTVALRKIVEGTNKEVLEILQKLPNLHSYYACVFAIGSIMEAIVDDVLVKEKKLVGRIFLKLPNIGKNASAVKILKKLGFKVTHNNTITRTELIKIGKWTPDHHLMCGEKLELLRLLIENKKPPMERHVLLEMYLINAFRNQIHPERRRKARSKVPWYLAAGLFTFITHIAGNAWPKNLRSLLK